MSDPGETDRPGDDQAGDDRPGEEQRRERAQLLPEEQAVGSDDPQAQAEAILRESAERTERPDPDDSSQSGRRASDETL
jgi:hypothetical protein